MKEIGLIFKAEMVQAILAGRKTQTRRLKFNGKPGDLIWVRESWADTNGESGPMISYKAGGDRFLSDDAWPIEYERYPGGLFATWSADLRRGEDGRWRPSIFMPRWASRITLEVVEVREQRLQDISTGDCRDEGVTVEDCLKYAFQQDEEGAPYRLAFRGLWDKINGKRASFESNPTVKAVTFRRVK